MQTPTLPTPTGLLAGAHPAHLPRVPRAEDLPDLREVARGLDIPDRLDELPGRLDAALADAGESLRDAGEAIRATVHTLSAPRRRRRRPGMPAVLVLLAAGVAVAGIGAWWVRRSMASAARRPPRNGVDTTTSARLDREAVDRATDEGMATSPGANDRLAATLVDQGALDSLADAPQRPLVATGPGIAGTGDLSIRPSAGTGSSPER